MVLFHGIDRFRNGFDCRVSFPSSMRITYRMVVGTDGYASISSVTTFRIILNHYFGAKYPLRPDESYYSTVKHPYRLTGVTEKLKGSKDDEDSIRRAVTR